MSLSRGVCFSAPLHITVTSHPPPVDPPTTVTAAMNGVSVNAISRQMHPINSAHAVQSDGSEKLMGSCGVCGWSDRLFRFWLFVFFFPLVCRCASLPFPSPPLGRPTALSRPRPTENVVARTQEDRSQYEHTHTHRQSSSNRQGDGGDATQPGNQQTARASPLPAAANLNSAPIPILRQRDP